MTCMKDFDFNRPFNVTLIVEDFEIDRSPGSVSTKFNKFCENAHTQNSDNNVSMTSRQGTEREYLNRCGNISYKRAMTNDIYNERVGFIDTSNENLTFYKTHLIYMLDRLSESIIEIANSFHDIYQRFANISYQNERISEEINLKKQKFYNSLNNNVISIIVKQQKNYVFMKKILSRTVEIARLKSFDHITEDVVNHFIVDIITWKNNQYQCSDISSKTRQPHFHSTAAHINKSKKRKDKHSNVRIFSYGSSENQITLDIDSQLLKHILNSKNTKEPRNKRGAKNKKQ